MRNTIFINFIKPFHTLYQLLKKKSIQIINVHILTQHCLITSTLQYLNTYFKVYKKIKEYIHKCKIQYKKTLVFINVITLHVKHPSIFKREHIHTTLLTHL